VVLIVLRLTVIKVLVFHGDSCGNYMAEVVACISEIVLLDTHENRCWRFLMCCGEFFVFR